MKRNITSHLSLSLSEEKRNKCNSNQDDGFEKIMLNCPLPFYNTGTDQLLPLSSSSWKEDSGLAFTHLPNIYLKHTSSVN